MDVGEPLNLTEYIVDNKIDEAKQKALVDHPDLKDIAVSYSGYFSAPIHRPQQTVQVNIFTWFFPAEVLMQIEMIIILPCYFRKLRGENSYGIPTLSHQKVESFLASP